MRNLVLYHAHCHDGLVVVAVVAVIRHGGGGHRNAAGFEEDNWATTRSI